MADIEYSGKPHVEMSRENKHLVVPTFKITCSCMPRRMTYLVSELCDVGVIRAEICELWPHAILTTPRCNYFTAEVRARHIPHRCSH